MTREQAFEIDLSTEERTVILTVLNSISIEGGRAEGRRIDRAATALETAADGAARVRLTIENVEMILAAVDRATQLRKDGTSLLTGLGFRRLRPALDRLEAAQRGDLSVGVEAASGNGARRTDG